MPGEITRRTWVRFPLGMSYQFLIIEIWLFEEETFSCQNWCICNAQLLYIFDLKMLAHEMSMRMQWFFFVVVPTLRDTDSTLILSGYGWLFKVQPSSNEKFMHLLCTVGVYFIYKCSTQEMSTLMQWVSFVFNSHIGYCPCPIWWSWQ